MPVGGGATSVAELLMLRFAAEAVEEYENDARRIGKTALQIKIDSGKLLLVVDLLGTFLFGMEGATAAIANNLDLLGLMVLAFATALSGGIIRELLIGVVPPGALRDWRYSAAAFTGGAIVFLRASFCPDGVQPSYHCS